MIRSRKRGRYPGLPPPYARASGLTRVDRYRTAHNALVDGDRSSKVAQGFRRTTGQRSDLLLCIALRVVWAHEHNTRSTPPCDSDGSKFGRPGSGATR